MNGKKFQITLSDLSYNQLNFICKSKGMKKSTIIALAIEHYLYSDNVKIPTEERNELKK